MEVGPMPHARSSSKNLGVLEPYSAHSEREELL